MTNDSQHIAFGDPIPGAPVSKWHGRTTPEGLRLSYSNGADVAVTFPVLTAESLSSRDGRDEAWKYCQDMAYFYGAILDQRDVFDYCCDAYLDAQEEPSCALTLPIAHAPRAAWGHMLTPTYGWHGWRGV